MTDVSLAAAFLAGLVSFLSPCVLPLVPGYISMLSGIGMEQLRQGQQPRGGLFASALAFVLGFSVVFISFGASASAVGSFLREHRGTLAPIAGALILLFGLHLLGLLGKLTIRVGLILGVLLAILGVVAAGAGWHAVCRPGRGSFLFAFDDWVFRAGDDALAESRCAPAQQGDAARHVERIFAGFCVCVWVDAVHRADPRHGVWLWPPPATRSRAGCCCWRFIRQAWRFRFC